MTSPDPMPPANNEANQSSSGSITMQLCINIGWAAFVLFLGICNWMPKEFMAASLAMNIIVTGASLMRKTPETAKVVTDLNKGLVIITVLSALIQFLFGYATFRF